MPAKPSLPLDETELVESFSHASGPGGQNVNKVATRVTLAHRPSGISISVQDTRSQSENRRIARERLAGHLEKLAEEKRRLAIDAQEKQRRRNRKRPAAVKRAFREGKRKRAEIKRGRGRGRVGDD